MYSSWRAKFVVVFWCVHCVCVLGVGVQQLNDKTLTLQEQQQQQVDDLIKDLQQLRLKIAQLEARLDAANDNVVFHAVVQSDAVLNVNARNTVVYDRVITNTGSSYNNTTGIFTVPVPATYYFQFSCAAPAGQRLNLTLQVDLEVKAVCVSLGETSSSTAALQLHPLSKVRVTNIKDEPQQMFGGHSAQFSGFMINAFSWQ